MVDYLAAGTKLNQMVEREPERLDRVFHALADPTRRAMLRSLSRGERNIGELAAPFEMSFAAASKHVRVLELAGLLSRRVEGRSHVCLLRPKPMAEASRWLAFYEQSKSSTSRLPTAVSRAP